MKASNVLNRRYSRASQWLFLTLLFLQPLAFADNNNFEQAIQQLTQRSYPLKIQAIENIAQSQSPQTEPFLKKLLASEVYYRKSDKKIFYLVERGDNFQIEEVISGKKQIVEDKYLFKKVIINNRMRSIIHQEIAGLQLNSSNPTIRKSAVAEILKKVNDDDVSLISRYIKTETNNDVKKLMQTVIAIGTLHSNNESDILSAIKTLDGNLEPIVRIRLKNLVSSTDNQKIKAAAQKSLLNIQGKLDLYDKLKTLYFGLSFGSVLVLAGIGLAITFGVMGVINMAHGELIMLGAYTTYLVQQLMPDSIGISIIIAIPAAFIVSGLVGILMERTVIRHLYGRPLETLLATFGISLILQQAVRTIFSPLNRTVITPEWMSGTLTINSAFSLTWNRLYIIIFCLIVFFSLLAVMKKTALGLQVRAVSQNRTMAKAMGVRSDWVDALTFGLGAGIAGVAGVALSLLTNVGPNLGQSYIIDSFMVVVFGGVGNLWGTLVAGTSLGIVNKLLEPWAGAVLAKILVLIFIILFIQKRPRGLFPQRGRAAEN